MEEKQSEEALIKRLQLDIRAESLRKMEENKTFMKEWEDEGKKNWRANQTKRKETIQKAQYYEDREVKLYKDKLMKELDEATREMGGGIDEFEKNL